MFTGTKTPLHPKVRSKDATTDHLEKPRKLPALRGFVGGLRALATAALYLAFFFLLGKAVKGVGNAVIPTFPCIGHTNFKGLSNAAANTPTLLLSMGITR